MPVLEDRYKEGHEIAPVAVAPGDEAHLVVLHHHAPGGTPAAALHHLRSRESAPARSLDDGREHLAVARIPLGSGFGERDLSRAFTATNSIETAWYENPKAHPLVSDVRSTSVGDVAVLEVNGVPHSAYKVESVGWTKMDAVPGYLSEKDRRDLFAQKLGLSGGASREALEALAPIRNKDGYVPVWVRRDEIAGKASGPTADFVSTFKDAVAQPLYVHDPDTCRNVASGARTHGAAGMRALEETFGRSQYRSMQFDAGAIAAKTLEDAGRARTVLAAIETNKARGAEIAASRREARAERTAPRRGPVGAHEIW